MDESNAYETHDVPNSTYRVITIDGVYIGLYNTMLDKALDCD